MARPIARSSRTWACRTLLILSIAAIATASGCAGLMLGPVVERRVIIVRAGVPIEITDQIKVHGHVLKEDGTSTDIVEVDIGGWVAMHPDHWEALKREVRRLRGREEGR